MNGIEIVGGATENKNTSKHSISYNLGIRSSFDIATFFFSFFFETMNMDILNFRLISNDFNAISYAILSSLFHGVDYINE